MAITIKERLFSEDISFDSLFDATVLAALLGTFLQFALSLFEFTLDDAFITLRYSKHLANGRGIVWNIGGEPVEGYTSTLWMLLGTIPHLLELNPVLFMKIVGVAMMVGVISGIYLYGRKLGRSRPLLLAICGIIVTNPAMALISVQGMETTTAMLFVLVAGVSGIELIQAFNRRWLITLYLSLGLAMLTRPGLAVFSVGFLIGLTLVVFHNYGLSSVKSLIRGGTIGLLIPGIGYVVARRIYFGYLFPNPFYIKEGGGTIQRGGLVMTQELVTLILPLVIVGILSVVIPNVDYRRLLTALPLFLGGSMFLAMWLFFKPEQAFFWRFQLPALPAILLGIVIVAQDFSSIIPEALFANKDTRAHTIIVGLVLITLLTVPLQYGGQAAYTARIKTSETRIKAGQALGAVPNASEHTMLVSESGAVPYYSEWKAIDILGLNSEYIAHNGLDIKYLNRYDPDLIMIGASGKPEMVRRRSTKTAQYVATQNYKVVAVIAKVSDGVPSGWARQHYHVYLVDPDTPQYRAIACQLQTIEGVKYMNRSLWADRINSSTGATTITSADCR